MSFVEKIDTSDLLNPRTCLQDDNLVRNILKYNGVNDKLANARIVIYNVFQDLGGIAIQGRAIQTREDIEELAKGMLTGDIVKEGEIVKQGLEYHKQHLQRSPRYKNCASLFKTMNINTDTGLITSQKYIVNDKDLSCITITIGIDENGQIAIREENKYYTIDFEDGKVCGAHITSTNQVDRVYNEDSVEMDRKVRYTDYRSEKPEISVLRTTRLQEYPFAVKVECGDDEKTESVGIWWGSPDCSMPPYVKGKIQNTNNLDSVTYFEKIIGCMKPDDREYEYFYRLLTERDKSTTWNLPRRRQPENYWYSYYPYVEDDIIKGLVKLGLSQGLINESQLEQDY